jgi:Right handed beta helix region
MRKIALSIAAMGLAFAPMLFAVPAHAQASRTWVSGTGDDVNPCSRTAPCKTYAGAISKTATNGEINCLDPGGFGALTITKSISVVCDYTEGGVLAANVNGFIVNAPAGSIVTLKGQDIECFATGINGIEMVNVGVVLHVHKTQIRNCRASGGNGNGILVANNSGVSTVLVADSYITDNGGTNQNAGILVRPTAGAQTNVIVDNVRLEANTNGIFMDGAGGGGASNVNVKRSLISGNSTNGVSVFGTGALMRATVADSLISSNAGSGVTAAGAGASVKIGSNTITHNVTGVSGSAQSFKNNQIVDNGTDGTPVTAVSSGGSTLN